MAKPKKMPAKAKEFAFEKGDFVVYPTHGVGRVIDIEAKEIAGHKLDLFVISFEQERMMLRVPVAKAKISGLRKLSSRKIMENALVTLKGRSRVSRAMWNRRAQEYEAKINSGDPVSIAEVVRDLHRNAGQPDQSYSERQIYEAALDRLAREAHVGATAALVPTLYPGQGILTTNRALARSDVILRDEDEGDRAEWLVVSRRSAYWRPDISERLRAGHGRLVAVRSRHGVWLAALWHFSPSVPQKPEHKNGGGPTQPPLNESAKDRDPKTGQRSDL